LDRARKLLPVWLLGLANVPLGSAGGIMLLTLPQLLSARHVSEPVIAQMTSLALVPTFGVFLLGPLVDVRFSRRTYAVAATILAAAGVLVGLLFNGNLQLLGAAMFCSMLGAALNTVAIGGWLGSLVSKEADARLGAWFVAANVGAFGVVSMIGIAVVRALPLPAAAAVLATPTLIPLAIYALTPAPPPDQRLARESFGRFFADLAALVRQPQILRLLLLFAAPAASFALTNTLGGLGRDYHASEAFVATIGGAAVTGAGVIGSLLVPLLARRAAPVWLYLGVGTLGALFTLCLIGLPRTPLFFAAAMVG
jgi:PAT family beta-lactamase induction signal transducer AmpG